MRRPPRTAGPRPAHLALLPPAGPLPSAPPVDVPLTALSPAEILATFTDEETAEALSYLPPVRAVRILQSALLRMVGNATTATEATGMLAVQIAADVDVLGEALCHPGGRR